MVEIPEGPFKMGSTNGDYDEAPEHQVYLATFYIDKYEVTQAEYDRFVRATKRGKPFVPVFDDDISKILKQELAAMRSEEHTSELQSRQYLVCRLLLEKKKKEKNEHGIRRSMTSRPQEQH